MFDTGRSARRRHQETHQMGRRLRYVPEGAMVEITTRTLHGRCLLKPVPEVKEIILGALGRAQRLYGVEIHYLVFLSNHYHLLITPGSALAMARFINYVNSRDRPEGGPVLWMEGEVLG